MDRTDEMTLRTDDAALIIARLAKEAGAEGVSKEDVRKVLEEKGFFTLWGDSFWSFFGTAVRQAKMAKYDGGVRLNKSHTRYFHRSFPRPEQPKDEEKVAVVKKQLPPNKGVPVTIVPDSGYVTITDETGTVSFSNVKRVIVVRGAPPKK